MIGGILPNNDLSVFLTKDYVKDLDSQTIKGTLVRLKDRMQIPMELKKDDEKSKYGLAVEEGDTYHIFIFSRFYSKLDKIGYVGARNPLGWGIKIAKEGYACKDLLLYSELRLLKKLDSPV